MLCVYDVWRVRSLQHQLTTVRKKRKLGDNLYTDEADTEDVGPKDCDSFLDKLYTLLAAYALAGSSALAGVDPTKEASLGANSVEFVAPDEFQAAQESDSWEGGGEDWPDAYRHCPMPREHALCCVVVFWHEEWGEPAYQVYTGLLFGLPLAALGTPFAAAKKQRMAISGSFLGLEFDFSSVLTQGYVGYVSFFVRARLVEKVTDLIESARASNTLRAGVASKLYGMLNFLELGMFGRVGAGGLAAIKDRQMDKGVLSWECSGEWVPEDWQRLRIARWIKGRAYDELGKDTAAANLPKIEPVVFFAALFGTHHFEPFVGRLRLAQDIDMDLQLMMRDIIAEDEESGQIDALKVSRAHKRMLALERRRQVQCAVNLASRLDAHQDEGWEEAQRAEATRLSQVPSGLEMLYLIGWLYVNAAEQWLAGSAAARLVAKMRAKAHLIKSKGELAASAGRTAFTVNSIMKTAERKKTKQSAVQREGTEKEEEKEEQEKEAKAAAATEAAATTNASGQGEASASDGKAETEGMRSSRDAHEGNSSPSNAPAEGRGNAEEGGSQDILSPGTIVVLCNLRTNTELNDEVGVIEEFDESSGRYVVHFLSDGLEPRRLRAENLLILEDSASRGNDSKGSAGGSAAEDPKATPRAEDTSEDAHWAPGGDEAEVAEAFKDTMPLFHDTLWKVTAIDIEFTLAKVMRRVLRDMSIDKPARQHRAEALRRLGEIMQEPMKERRADQSASRLQLDEVPSVERRLSSRSSILARLPRVSWRSRKRESKEARTKQQETKQKQMEAALVLMAAGASTDDVDDMLAARSAMEAELDPFHSV
eukprot:s3674_g3.t1